ncbi:MAG: CHAT domain-containing protein [Myxacorys californica WJT36-NPBG1]|jgi:CHAT domain-containing protein|nr:CHAT domain-containing protein [Myxacorys californica WJT36-NPBG1]
MSKPSFLLLMVLTLCFSIGCTSFFERSSIAYSSSNNRADGDILHVAQAQPQPAQPALQKPDLVQWAIDRGDVEDAIYQIELRWKKQYEEYFQGKFTTHALPAPDMARALDQIGRETGRKPALVYAIPSPTHLDVMLVAPTGKAIHRRIKAANKAALTETVDAFRMGVVNSRSDPEDYLQPGQQLYQWIVQPIESDLKANGINTLIFCLGGGLRSAPLAALHDGKQFLVEQYNLGIIPAFNLLDRQARNSPETQILAMGASTFRQQTPLPGVPLEISSITKTPWQGTSLLNQDFTLANLKSQRAKYPYGIVHLATHAEFAAGAVQKSYIQFWDRQLRLDQLKELGLQQPPVQLLVLSACRTALGDAKAEIGFAGLAVQAGSKAAMASLWSVDDGSTVLLMQEFYRQLKTAPIKADALRETQLTMIRHPETLMNSLRGRQNLPPELSRVAKSNLSHPHHWAGFTMIGNPW